MNKLSFINLETGATLAEFPEGSAQFITMWPTVWTKPFRITEVPGIWISAYLHPKNQWEVYVTPWDEDTGAVAAPAGPQPESTTSASAQQPMPIDGKESVTDWLVEQLREHTRRGIETYGKPLQTFNGRDALWDAFEEALDLCQYLAQALMERNYMAEALKNARG